MNTNRVLLVLVSLTVAMQGTLVYQQYRRSARSSQTQVAPAETPAVQNAQQDISIDLTPLPIKGRKDARVVLVEFSDYQCPFCARHTATVEPDLETQFVASGKIRYAFANNPLPFHLNAKPLATAAICAGDQGNYWEMHDRLFAKQPKTMDEVESIVQSLKLDVAQFKRCRDSSPEPDKRIDSDRQKAQELRMNFTPGFAIGIADNAGRLSVKKLISGAQPIEVFSRTLNELLAENEGNAKQSDHP